MKRMPTNPNPDQKAEFTRLVEQRNGAALQALTCKTYPRVLWGNVLRDLDLDDRKWAEGALMRA